MQSRAAAAGAAEEGAMQCRADGQTNVGECGVGEQASIARLTAENNLTFLLGQHPGFFSCTIAR